MQCEHLEIEHCDHLMSLACSTCQLQSLSSVDEIGKMVVTAYSNDTLWGLHRFWTLHVELLSEVCLLASL